MNSQQKIENFERKMANFRLKQTKNGLISVVSVVKWWIFGRVCGQNNGILMKNDSFLAENGQISIQNGEFVTNFECFITKNKKSF